MLVRREVHAATGMWPDRVIIVEQERGDGRRPVVATIYIDTDKGAAT